MELDYETIVLDFQSPMHFAAIAVYINSLKTSISAAPDEHPDDDRVEQLNTKFQAALKEHQEDVIARSSACPFCASAPKGQYDQALNLKLTCGNEACPAHGNLVTKEKWDHRITAKKK